jgi:hypothetical protein
MASRRRSGQVNTTPTSASGTSTPKWPTIPSTLSGHEYSACVSRLSVSSTSVALHSNAALRAVSFTHAPGADVMKSIALSIQ